MVAELVLSEINLKFGGITVLEDVSVQIEDGHIFGLVGPNGAGKTSLFNCVSGHYRLSSGSIKIGGIETLSQPAWRMSRLGLARTFQHPALQLHESVLENVLLGAHSSLRGGPVSWALRLPSSVRGERVARAEALELLERFDIGWSADIPAGELSPGLHKSIELCRALMSKPHLLLLDEPTAGLSHGEVEAFISTIGTVPRPKRPTAPGSCRLRVLRTLNGSQRPWIRRSSRCRARPGSTDPSRPLPNLRD